MKGCSVCEEVRELIPDIANRDQLSDQDVARITARLEFLANEYPRDKWARDTNLDWKAWLGGNK